jgi:hypothetical protein
MLPLLLVVCAGAAVAETEKSQRRALERANFQGTLTTSDPTEIWVEGEVRTESKKSKEMSSWKEQSVKLDLTTLVVMDDPGWGKKVKIYCPTSKTEIIIKSKTFDKMLAIAEHHQVKMKYSI